MVRYQELRVQIAKSKAAAGQPKKEARPAAAAQPKVKAQKAEPEVVETEPSEQPAAAVQEELILTDERPQVIADKQVQVTAAAVETLAQAVEEIKRYIHAEIKALKKEIQNLRTQK